MREFAECHGDLETFRGGFKRRDVKCSSCREREREAKEEMLAETKRKGLDGMRS